MPAVAIFIAKPGEEEKVEELLTSLVIPSNAEQGVISYRLHRDREDPQRFVFTEEWESQTALDAHVGSAHVRKVFDVLPDYLDGSEIIFLNRLAPPS